MAAIGSIIDGKYQIEKMIAKGGMSTVYLAKDVQLENKKWAIKEIKRTGNEKHENDEIIGNSILTEINVMTKLDHQYLPRIVGIKNNGNTSSVIMDYIEGEPLSEVLEKYGAQSEENVIKWAKQLCEALLYLHTQTPPIIYRDMKPSNIMLKPDGNIRVIDFGIAKEYRENAKDSVPVGTKGYAAPEQCQCYTDERSDIYALGMTIHYLLTGVNPCIKVKDKKGKTKVIVREYQPIRYYNPKLSEEIELVIDKCVKENPEERYQNCSELLYDLEHPEELTRAYKRKQKRKAGSFFASAVLTILFLVLGVTCSMAATNINNNDYNSLINKSTASMEEKIDSYKKAIRIYPYRLNAYSKIIKVYSEGEGVFSKSESDEFLALYNANKDGFDKTSSEEAKLNYDIGKLYINSYMGEDLSDRVQRAFPFFELNHDNENISSDFKEKSLSDCYYNICYFYKKYILTSSSVEEASKNDYDELINTINNTFDDMEKSDVVNGYDKLLLYNTVFMLMYDQRINMLQVHVDKQKILDVLDVVHTGAYQSNPQKEQAKTLKQNIMDNYEIYEGEIIKIYEREM